MTGSDPNSLDGRAFLLTGGAGGLARGVAESLLAAGARLVISDLPGAALESARNALAEHGEVTAIPADLTREDQVDALVDSAVETYGQLDGLVATAGILHVEPFASLSKPDWDRTFQINLTGTFLLLQRVGNYLTSHPRSDGGTHPIVLFSSATGRLGRPDIAHYAASKAGIISLTKSAALAYAPLVRVNAVCPGVFLTHMWDGATARREEQLGEGAGDRYLDALVESVPLGRTGRVEELGSFVRFLLEDGSSFINGQAINIDGGMDMP